MRMANQKKFNMDMEAYIRSRRREENHRGELAVRIKRDKPEKPAFVYDKVPDITSDSVHVEYDDISPTFLSRLFSSKRREVVERASDELTPEEKKKLLAMENKLEGIEAEIESVEEEKETMDEIEDELQEERESLMDKLLSFLGLGGRIEDDYEEIEDYNPAQVNLVDEDVKHVLKIAHKWIEKLSAKDKKAFKDSEDFERYKEILVRYGMIKSSSKQVEAKTEVVTEEVKEKPKPKKKKIEDTGGAAKSALADVAKAAAEEPKLEAYNDEPEKSKKKAKKKK